MLMGIVPYGFLAREQHKLVAVSFLPEFAQHAVSRPVDSNVKQSGQFDGHS